MNGPDLSQYAPPLLAIVGALMQYLRAMKGFREEFYHALVVVFAAGVYFLVTNPHGQGWRMEVILGLLGVSGYVSAIWGGTFVASNAAKGAVARATTDDQKLKTAANVFVPLTNSK